MALKKILRTTMIAALLCVGSSATAATFMARISSVLFYEQGDLVYIYVEGGTQGRPACAGSNGDYISFSMKRPRAKEYMSGLLFAYGAGKPVTFYTSGSCVDQAYSDTLQYFSVGPG